MPAIDIPDSLYLRLQKLAVPLVDAGLRSPHLKRVQSTPDRLDAILAPAKEGSSSLSSPA